MTYSGMQEGHSIARPPLFNGSDYTYWKTRMRIFLISMDFELWSIVENGFQKSSLPMSEWNESEKKVFALNAKAMNALFCALDKNEFNRVSICDSAFDIWRTLEVTHEGTSRVKESKINILVHSYELFRMKPSESIGDMYTRFTDVINGLKALGKDFTNFELVTKILRSLPKSWDPKVTAIQEAKDLKAFPLEELIGSLMTYEMTCQAHDELENPLPKNRKDMALKSQEDHLKGTSSDEDSDNDIALLTQKFKKYLRKNKFKNNIKHKFEQKKDQVICYECKKPGHYKNDCPQAKKRTSKKKALKATWDDSSASEEEESNTEQVAHYALMALGEEICDLFNLDLSFEELSIAFHELFDECRTVSKKLSILKKEHALLQDKFDSLQTPPCSKCEHLEAIKNENMLLKETLNKFKVGSKGLDMILAHKGHIVNRNGIGFVKGLHQNPTTFIKGPTLHVSSYMKCNFCCKSGHIAYKCPFRKISSQKLIWVPKGTIKNSIINNKVSGSIFEAPKIKWVPKNHPLL